MRNMIDQILEATGSSGSIKATKPKSSRKGKHTPNGDFTKKICLEHAEAVKAFKDANPEQKGAHLVFVSNYKKEHADEYASFVANWKETQSEDDSGTTSDSVVTKKVASKKSAIVTPVVIPAAVNTVEELLPFTMGGVSYLRMGSQRPDGNHLWTSGHLWMSKKGAKGAHVGELQENGTINTDADEPSI